MKLPEDDKRMAVDPERLVKRACSPAVQDVHKNRLTLETVPGFRLRFDGG